MPSLPPVDRNWLKKVVLLPEESRVFDCVILASVGTSVQAWFRLGSGLIGDVISHPSTAAGLRYVRSVSNSQFVNKSLGS
jgi:hypothetical protein